MYHTLIMLDPFLNQRADFIEGATVEILPTVASRHVKTKLGYTNIRTHVQIIIALKLISKRRPSIIIMLK